MELVVTIVGVGPHWSLTDEKTGEVLSGHTCYWYVPAEQWIGGPVHKGRLSREEAAKVREPGAYKCFFNVGTGAALKLARVVSKAS